MDVLIRFAVAALKVGVSGVVEDEFVQALANQGINIGSEKLDQYRKKCQQELSQILTDKSLRKMNVPEGYIVYVKEEIEELFQSVSLEEDLFRNCRYDATSLAGALYKKYKEQKKDLVEYESEIHKVLYVMSEKAILLEKERDGFTADMLIHIINSVDSLKKQNESRCIEIKKTEKNAQQSEKNINDTKVLCASIQNKREYCEKLWINHHKGIVRDHVATGNVRELIDFFVIPSITTASGEVVSMPFEGSKFSKFLMAGSGFGKSTLLDMLLLCNVAKKLFELRSSVLSSNSKNKIREYNEISESLFGSSTSFWFPVFIHSDKANYQSYSSVLELAEANEVVGFESMVNEANRSGTLLFLIDSIDEVESDKINLYLNSINKMLSFYPNASIVFASRFLGKKTLPFEYELLHIRKLKMADIKKITFSMLSQNEANKLIAELKRNKYMCSLAENPFMLMTMLESKGDRLLHHLLESIVNAIIDRRWEKHHYDISSEDIKLLLGFLACKFVFENREYADISEIRQCFLKAGDNLKLYGVSYDVPSQNIEYFLKTLSSQSGILNIVNQYHVEKYLFQDDLVMCWLAANYINKIINESSEIHDREGLGGIWANIYWLDSFLRSISSKEPFLSILAVNVLIMTLVMSSETNGQDIQKSVLYFLICRDATSLDEQEQLNIRSGYRDLVNNSFGENDITNRSNSECLKLINKMLDAHRNQM